MVKLQCNQNSKTNPHAVAVLVVAIALIIQFFAMITASFRATTQMLTLVLDAGCPPNLPALKKAIGFLTWAQGQETMFLLPDR